MYPYQGGSQPDQMKGLCKKYMNYHVMGELNDGSQFEGIIEDMDDEGVTMLVPEEVDADQVESRYGYGGNYDDYDYDGYGRPRRRRHRRFRRQRFPFFLLRRLLLYPYYYPYPGYGYGGYY